MQAAPLANDPVTMSSRFTGALPDRLRKGDFYVAAPGIVVDGQGYMLRLALLVETVPTMPVPIPSESAKGLYLVAGGLYSVQDIEANGHQTASDKYRDFLPAHDPNPGPGDPICPVTRTKANRGCSWIIGGETYFFCCPPCIDEFLALAKDQPNQISLPDAYHR
jgi:YHS domain-containing protein